MHSKKTKFILASGTVLIITLAIVAFSLFNKDEHTVQNSEPSPTVNQSTETNVTINEHSGTSAGASASIQKYIIKSESLISSFVAPSYINDQLIAFERDISEKSTSYIDTFSRSNKQLKNVYQTQKKEIINSLVGVEDKLFWVEYGRIKQKDMTWKIKSLDLKTNQVKTLFSGESEDSIDPPVLRVFNDQITWIDNKIIDKVVYGTAILYKPMSNELIKVVTSELDESNEHRNGTFMAIQRPIKDGMLIQQSIFKTEGSTTDKSYEIIFLPYDKTKSIVLKKGQGIIDFTANEEWFIWCEIGKINVASRKTGEVKYVIDAKDKDLTVDSPFILNDHLYYRYSMYQIIDTDLKTGKWKELSGSRLSTSKIFSTADYLGFSYMDARSNNGEVEFDIISQT